ncbi:A24 family peptidase [Burkholderia cepacia]|uniref:A24 family peptidase n=1 Tax=Burkholderia cepacia TaxID=292 RepID=UPI00158A9642|nr:prepilin peptidase [Burkholderia cepacia]MBY4709669.1 prepilin peptidase [Burkholderia cepacia]MBY4738637.1 prepilin peptidase [Burkholderia cepacia]MBY4747070.1 prepilin peptidase [Burkholderia cepacia]MBY4757785.1 prepilin peptidase [Burkholderia cepacia]MBY4778532.1 prepilin peptidase [Burkholderia cepacia]
MAHLLSTSIFFAWATLVAVGDIRFRLVRNPLVVVGLLAALGSALVNANPFRVSVEQALIGMLVGFVSFFPLFAFRVMGAADVKVFAVLGAWCGLSILPWLWVVASLAAGIHVLALMTLTHTSLGALWSRGSPTLALGARRATPYAACLVAPAAIWLAYLVVTGGLQ